MGELGWGADACRPEGHGVQNRPAAELAENLSKDASTKTETVPFDVTAQMRTPEEMAAYLDAWLAEAPGDAAGVAYKALSENGNPSLATVLKVARVLGMRLHAGPA